MTSQQIIHSPYDKDFKKYQAYFCHAGVDTSWVINFINILESDRYGLKCAEYERDFLGGKYVFDLFQYFMEYSHFMVVVISPSFLESRWSMFQLYLAVQYSLDNNEGNIIPLVYKDCDIPPCLKVFDPVDATRKGWEKTFLERLCQPAKRFPKNKGICTRNGHISLDALKTCSTRDVISEPILQNTVLSEHNFSKVKTHHYRRKGKMDFMEERQKSDDIAAESAQANSEINTKERRPPVDILHLQTELKKLTNEELVRPSRKRSSKDRVDAETILEMEGKIDTKLLSVAEKSKSVRKTTEHIRGRMDADELLQIHNCVQENTLQKGEQTRAKRTGASKKSRNTGDVEYVCKDDYDQDLIKNFDPQDSGVSKTDNGDTHSNREMLIGCARLSDECDSSTCASELSSHSDNMECMRPIPPPIKANMDCGYNSFDQCLHNVKKSNLSNGNVDMTKHDTTLESAHDRSVSDERHLKTVEKPLLPDELLTRVGDCAKGVRERNRRCKTRLDADMLLQDFYETTRQ